MSCKNCSDVTLLSGNDGNGIQTIVDNGDGTFTIFMTDGSTFTTPDFDGAAATVTAGIATGLAPGAAPTVANGGTPEAAVFNFGIPAGATGATGAGLGILSQRDVSASTTLGSGSINALTTIGAGTATPIVLTIQDNATQPFDIGQTFILQKSLAGSGTVTITATAVTVTLNGVVGGSFVITNVWEGAMLIKIATDSWNIIRLGT